MQAKFTVAVLEWWWSADCRNAHGCEGLVDGMTGGRTGNGQSRTNHVSASDG